MVKLELTPVRLWFDGAFISRVPIQGKDMS